ncbi:MAG: sugar-binding protein [Succinivibrio sp.]
MRALRTSLLALVGAVIAMNTAHAYKVAIAMPTQMEDRWYSEGYQINKLLQDGGFTTELFFAGDGDIELQQRQVERISKSDADLLVIASVDSLKLSEQLKIAESKKTPVISYDRLIMNSNAPSYYLSVDNEMIGEMQGEALVKALRPGAGHVKYIELFAGDLDDNNAHVFFNGAMKKLRNYIDMGYIVIKSGQKSIEAAHIEGWDTDVANKRMNDLITKIGYGPNGEKLDGILCPADCVADGIIYALKRQGYTPDNIPFITGCDATRDALKRIEEGYQGMTIYKSGELGTSLLEMVKAISNGDDVDVTDDYSYNNGVKVMESVLCDPMPIDKSNVHFAQ